MRRGLSLLEVLLATAILGFALLTLVGVFSAGLRSTRQSRQVTDQVRLARSIIERMDFARLPPGNVTYPEGGANVTLVVLGPYLKEVRVQAGSVVLEKRLGP